MIFVIFFFDIRENLHMKRGHVGLLRKNRLSKMRMFLASNGQAAVLTQIHFHQSVGCLILEQRDLLHKCFTISSMTLSGRDLPTSSFRCPGGSTAAAR